MDHGHSPSSQPAAGCTPALISHTSAMKAPAVLSVLVRFEHGHPSNKVEMNAQDAPEEFPPTLRDYLLMKPRPRNEHLPSGRYTCHERRYSPGQSDRN